MMLKIENLYAQVDGKPILRGALALNAVEMHAIMGPNGADESTLDCFGENR